MSPGGLEEGRYDNEWRYITYNGGTGTLHLYLARDKVGRAVAFTKARAEARAEAREELERAGSKDG